MSLTARKTRFYGLVLVLTSLIVSMGLGEIVLRLISSDQYYVWPPGLRNIFHPAPDVMPGINGESRFSINDQGLRGDPFSENQTYRILAIGGSTTECLYLDDLEAWPYLLQEALNATADPKRRVWVGNAGRSGHNTRHHLVQAEMLTRQYPKIDAVLLLIGANDFWQRISMDQKFRPFPGVEKLPLDEYEALMDRAFSAWPRADSHFPFFKRTAIWRTAREVRKRYLNPPKPEAMQDDAGLVYKKWRTHRALAGSIRSSLPDLAPALEEYSKNVNTLIDYAKSKKTRIILVTQPHMWNPGMPSEEQALLWGGGIGNFQGESGGQYYSIAALAEGLKMYNATLLGICRTRNVECIDLESRLKKDTSNFYDDLHFNEGGSRNVAAVLGEYLARSVDSTIR